MPRAAARPDRTVAITLIALLTGAGPMVAASQPGITPDSLATEFQTALRAMAWSPAATRIHPDGLRRLHDQIDMLVEVDSATTLEVLFDGIGAAEYRSLSSADVFIRVMVYMANDMPGLLHALVVRDVGIIGAVMETQDLAHVVYRSEARLSGAVRELRVMTLKRSPDGWRVLETPELDVIREALRGIPRRGTPAQPP